MKEKFFRPEIMDKSMTPDLREQAIHPKGKVASQNDNSREARNTYSEGAVRPRTAIVGRCPPETSSA